MGDKRVKNKYTSGALGGTRTPNLLIRRYLKPEHFVPYISYFIGFLGDWGLIRYHGISPESLSESLIVIREIRLPKAIIG